MNDQMNELVQFSPVAGALFLESVSGETSRKIEHENDVHAADGQDRSMYIYAPKSGCPDAKQAQILMVLRDDTSEASAQALLEELALAELAEQEHFLILFPNPTAQGWNYSADPARESDGDFLGRCFGALRGSKARVNGFNGMIYYLAATASASALVMTMAAQKPMSVPAMLLGAFPEDYEIPGNALNVETAAFVRNNPQAEHYLKNANGVSSEEYDRGINYYYGRNPNVRLAVTDRPLDADTVRLCWDRVFSLSRRWQNDTHGTYQKRTFFTARGFTPHVKDSSLGVNDGFAHTWYEYIPEHLRGTQEKVPLLFFFHGVNCVPLYGAEQSGWHEIADREGFIVVYPAPAVAKAWNIFNDPALPSDFAFVLALIDHIKTAHPIDESRIYIAGFSMGSMMTQALASVYPEIFAAAAPCNAFDFAYFNTPRGVYKGVVPSVDASTLQEGSTQRKMADARREKADYRIPIFHNVGFNDGMIAPWPVDASTDDVRTKTIARWKQINNIPGELTDPAAFSGLAADESFFEGERFYHQRWHSADPGSPVLYEMLLAKRMPHAIVPEQNEFAWEFIRKFRRGSQGELIIEA